MKSAAEVEAEVEASRSELDRNVDALKQKMTPGQLFDEAARAMGGTGQQVASKFAEQAKANPMPLAVMGLGLAWLMMSNNKGNTGGASYATSSYGEPRSFASGYDGDLSGSTGGGLKETAHNLGDKAQGMLSGMKSKVSGVGSSAAESGRSALHGAATTASNVRDKASDAAQHVQQSVSNVMESEPLLLAGLGLIVGAAIGAALPATEAENRTLGATRDKLMAKGKDLAHTALDKADTVGRQTYQAVKSELQNSEDGAEPADRIAEAVRTGVQTAKDELQGPAH